jgi:hypothetical protein
VFQGGENQEHFEDETQISKAKDAQKESIQTLSKALFVLNYFWVYAQMSGSFLHHFFCFYKIHLVSKTYDLKIVNWDLVSN